MINENNSISQKIQASPKVVARNFVALCLESKVLLTPSNRFRPQQINSMVYGFHVENIGMSGGIFYLLRHFIIRLY